MSTYNGEQYLSEQIDSILSQEGVDVTLFIRDDVSKDATITIIKAYLNRTNRVVLISGERNLGPERSFKVLLDRAYHYGDFEYFAYADQDDIWMSKKLFVAINRICDISKPALYGSNQYIYMNGLNKGLRFDEPPDTSLISSMSNNRVSGCTMVFNSILAKEMVSRLYDNEFFRGEKMHDTWTAVTANILGDFIYDRDAYILYRQHNNNVVGVKQETLLDKVYLQKKRKNAKKLFAEAILSCFNDVSIKEYEALNSLSTYDQSISSKIRLIKLAKRYRYFGLNKFVFISKVLSGWL